MSSLVTEISTTSPRVSRSRQICWNSFDDMRTTAMYSVSGMPKRSESMSVSLSSKSETRRCSAASNIRVSTSASSSALRVIWSSFDAHLRILATAGRFIPRDIARSQR
eukprot:Amastigsp_a342613_36.p3 type:complete len:108 gc:universal Amastigsp_a342613_36:535-212(-)